MGRAGWLTTAAIGPRDSAAFAFHASGAGPLLWNVSYMWEEHPDSQRNQAIAVILLVVGAILWCAGSALLNHDWPFLKEVLRFSAALAAALGIILIVGRILARVITWIFNRKGTKNGS